MPKSNVKELFETLSIAKKESVHANELQTTTVRLTPEIGAMLKVISSEKVLDFPVSNAFTELMSYELLSQMVSRSFVGDTADMKTAVDELNGFISKVSSKPDFIEDSNINNSMLLINNSGDYFNYENYFSTFSKEKEEVDNDEPGLK